MAHYYSNNICCPSYATYSIFDWYFAQNEGGITNQRNGAYPYIRGHGAIKHSESYTAFGGNVLQSDSSIFGLDAGKYCNYAISDGWLYENHILIGGVIRQPFGFDLHGHNWKSCSNHRLLDVGSLLERQEDYSYGPELGYSGPFSTAKLVAFGSGWTHVTSIKHSSKVQLKSFGIKNNDLYYWNNIIQKQIFLPLLFPIIDISSIPFIDTSLGSIAIDVYDSGFSTTFEFDNIDYSPIFYTNSTYGTANGTTAIEPTIEPQYISYFFKKEIIPSNIPIAGSGNNIDLNFSIETEATTYEEAQFSTQLEIEITGIRILNSGHGYSNANIVFSSDLTGNCAKCECQINNGNITDISILYGGRYSKIPKYTICGDGSGLKIELLWNVYVKLITFTKYGDYDDYNINIKCNEIDILDISNYNSNNLLWTIKKWNIIDQGLSVITTYRNMQFEDTALRSAIQFRARNRDDANDIEYSDYYPLIFDKGIIDTSKFPIEYDVTEFPDLDFYYYIPDGNNINIKFLYNYDYENDKVSINLDPDSDLYGYSNKDSTYIIVGEAPLRPQFLRSNCDNVIGDDVLLASIGGNVWIWDFDSNSLIPLKAEIHSDYTIEVKEYKGGLPIEEIKDTKEVIDHVSGSIEHNAITSNGRKFFFTPRNRYFTAGSKRTYLKGVYQTGEDEYEETKTPIDMMNRYFSPPSIPPNDIFNAGLNVSELEGPKGPFVTVDKNGKLLGQIFNNIRKPAYSNPVPTTTGLNFRIDDKSYTFEAINDMPFILASGTIDLVPKSGVFRLYEDTSEHILGAVAQTDKSQIHDKYYIDKNGSLILGSQGNAVGAILYSPYGNDTEFVMTKGGKPAIKSSNRYTTFSIIPPVESFAVTESEANNAIGTCVYNSDFRINSELLLESGVNCNLAGPIIINLKDQPISEHSRIIELDNYLIDGEMRFVAIEKGGSWFNAAPNIIVKGNIESNGSQAEATALIEGPLHIIIDSPGSNYSYPPKIHIDGYGIPPSKIKVNLNSNGEIESIDLSLDSKYSVLPNISLSDEQFIDNNGQSAIVRPILNGSVKSIIINNFGSKYLYAPDIIIDTNNNEYASNLYNELQAGIISRKEYDESPYTAVAQTNIYWHIDLLEYINPSNERVDLYEYSTNINPQYTGFLIPTYNSAVFWGDGFTYNNDFYNRGYPENMSTKGIAEFNFMMSRGLGLYINDNDWYSIPEYSYYMKPSIQINDFFVNISQYDPNLQLTGDKFFSAIKDRYPQYLLNHTGYGKDYKNLRRTGVFLDGYYYHTQVFDLNDFYHLNDDTVKLYGKLSTKKVNTNRYNDKYVNSPYFQDNILVNEDYNYYKLQNLTFGFSSENGYLRVKDKLVRILTYNHIHNPLYFNNNINKLYYLDMIRWQDTPSINLLDIYGMGAVININLDTDQKINEIYFDSEGNNEWSEGSTLRISDNSNIYFEEAIINTLIDTSSNSGVTGIIIENEGYGYFPNIQPEIIIDHNTGSGLKLKVNFFDTFLPSGIAGIRIIDGGSGYSSPPSIQIINKYNNNYKNLLIEDINYNLSNQYGNLSKYHLGAIVKYTAGVPYSPGDDAPLSLIANNSSPGTMFSTAIINNYNNKLIDYPIDTLCSYRHDGCYNIQFNYLGQCSTTFGAIYPYKEAFNTPPELIVTSTWTNNNLCSPANSLGYDVDKLKYTTSFITNEPYIGPGKILYFYGNTE